MLILLAAGLGRQAAGALVGQLGDAGIPAALEADGLVIRPPAGKAHEARGVCAHAGVAVVPISPIPAGPLDVAALVGGLGDAAERVTYRCYVGAGGAFTRIVDANGTSADAAVPLVEASALTAHAVDGDELAVTFVRFVSAETHCFGLRASDGEGYEWLCDLAGRVVAAYTIELEHQVLTHVPLPVFEQAQRLLAEEVSYYRLDADVYDAGILFHEPDREEGLLAHLAEELKRLASRVLPAPALAAEVTVALGGDAVPCGEGPQVLAAVRARLAALALDGEPVRVSFTPGATDFARDHHCEQDEPVEFRVELKQTGRMGIVTLGEWDG